MLPHRAESIAFIKQSIKSSFINNSSFLEDIDIVKLVEQMKPVYGRYYRFIGECLKKFSVDACFRAWIEAARRLVEKDHVTISCRQYSSRKREPLLLTAGQVYTFLPNLG